MIKHHQSFDVFDSSSSRIDEPCIFGLKTKNANCNKPNNQQ